MSSKNILASTIVAVLICVFSQSALARKYSVTVNATITKNSHIPSMFGITSSEPVGITVNFEIDDAIAPIVEVPAGTLIQGPASYPPLPPNSFTHPVYLVKKAAISGISIKLSSASWTDEDLVSWARLGLVEAPYALMLKSLDSDSLGDGITFLVQNRADESLEFNHYSCYGLNCEILSGPRQAKDSGGINVGALQVISAAISPLDDELTPQQQIVDLIFLVGGMEYKLPATKKTLAAELRIVQRAVGRAVETGTTADIHHAKTLIKLFIASVQLRKKFGLLTAAQASAIVDPANVLLGSF